MAEVVKGIVDIEINTGNSAAELKILQQQINSVFLSLNKNNAASLAASQKYSSSLADMVNSSKVFTAESVRMRTAAGALDDTLKRGQATLGQYFSARYVKSGALFAETLDLARQKASVLQTQFIATGKSSKGMQDALAIRPLQAFADQATVASQRTQILSSMFRQGTTQLVNFGKNVQWAGRQLMVGFTVPLTIFGATAGKVFRDLEIQVVNFKKVYGDLFTTPAELNKNLEAVKDLAKEYTKYGVAIKDTIGLAAQAAAAGRQNAEYHAQKSGGITSPLPLPSLVVHAGYVLARISFRTVLLRKWKQTFWIQYGPTQLLFFRNYADFVDWLNNPYHSAKARDYLVKLRVDFVSDLKKKSVMGYQVTQIRRKPYSKNIM